MVLDRLRICRRMQGIVDQAGQVPAGDDGLLACSEKLPQVVDLVDEVVHKARLIPPFVH